MPVKNSAVQRIIPSVIVIVLLRWCGGGRHRMISVVHAAATLVSGAAESCPGACAVRLTEISSTVVLRALVNFAAILGVPCWPVKGAVRCSDPAVIRYCAAGRTALQEVAAISGARPALVRLGTSSRSMERDRCAGRSASCFRLHLQAIGAFFCFLLSFAAVSCGASDNQ